VVALITIEVHARDVIDKLSKANCTSANDFEWVSQLRFYWDKDLNDCVVKQVCGFFALPVIECVCVFLKWVSQLRFYWDKDLNDCVVKQVCGFFALPVIECVCVCS